MPLSARVEFGLPAEYRSEITAAAPFGLAITVAAHGEVSSSRKVFASLTRFLVDLLQGGIPDSTQDIWLKFEEARTRSRGQSAESGDIAAH
jgi:hypothetical protein